MERADYLKWETSMQEETKTMLRKYLHSKEMKEHVIDILDHLLKERYNFARSLLINTLHSMKEKESVLEDVETPKKPIKK